MARTDVHAPGSTDFDPELYDCIDVFDLTPPADAFGFSSQNLGEVIDRLEARGYARGTGSAGTCGHCGQSNIRYVALLVREDVKQWIFVGERCLSHRFVGQTKASFQQLRKAAQVDRERQKLLAAFRALCDDNPSLAYATYAVNIWDAATGVAKDSLDWSTDVLRDICAKTRRYGTISERQADFVAKLVSEQEGRIADAQAKAAVKAEAAANLPELVEGRRELTGTIKSTKWVENDYGSTLKCLVELSDGNRLWGTVPSSILVDVEVDSKISFTAKVERSKDDEHFGFYSRPTKAKIL